MVIITGQPVSQLVQIGQPTSFTVIAVSSNGGASLSYQWMKDGLPLTSQNTDSLPFAKVSSDDSNVYSCLITDSFDNTTLLTSLVVLASSILDNVELNMKINILSMTTTGGFNWDWKTVNEENLAIGGFPRTMIEGTTITNLDSPNEPNAQAYNNSARFYLDITGSQAWSSNPKFTIRSNYRSVLDDLLRLFGPRETAPHVPGDCINDSCDEILFRSAKPLVYASGNIQTPAMLRTEWLVLYSQDRINPLMRTSS